MIMSKACAPPGPKASSSTPNSVATSHCIAISSCGIAASRCFRSANIARSYEPSNAGWSSGTMPVPIEASGVGYSA
jgi:hypothetical protein